MTRSLARRLAHPSLLGAAAALCLGACGLSSTEQTAPPSGSEPPDPKPAAELPAQLEHQLAWGAAPTGLRLRPRGFDSVAQGPDAVAVGADGLPLLLDRLAERIVQVAADGSVRTVATVPQDAQDLAAGMDGSFVAYSPLRATAWLFDEGGTRRGQLAVPRVFRQVLGLTLGPSRRVGLRNGFQETISLGSPAAPLPLATAMRTKREGAAFLSDGRGVVVVVADGRVELRVLALPTPEHTRPKVALRHELPMTAKAARIVGATDQLVCLRLETVHSTPTVTVERQAVCVDVLTGAITLNEALGPPGLYTPRTELAMGSGRLAFIRPIDTALRLRSWRVGRAQNDAAAKEVQP